MKRFRVVPITQREAFGLVSRVNRVRVDDHPTEQKLLWESAA